MKRRMMVPSCERRASLFAAAILCLAAASASAGVIIDENFDTHVIGTSSADATPVPVGKVYKWENGNPMSTTDAVHYGTGGKSLVFTKNNGATANQASVLNGVWDSSLVSSGVLTVSWEFNQAVADSNTLDFIGYNTDAWKALAMLHVKNTNLLVGNNSAAYTEVSVGTITPGVWYKVRFDFNIDNHTYNFYLNDTLTLINAPFSSQAIGQPLVHIALDGDFSGLDRGGAAVKYVDDLVVSIPEPASLATLGLGASGGLLLVRRRRH